MPEKEETDPLQSSLPNVYEGIRRSQLLLTLHDKISTSPPSAFAFLAEFEKLVQIIVPQIGETRVLFPEFTPHDEKLHVAKLFELADKFFGSAVYAQLSISELFLLASALYAHDWGMAVGSAEKEFLRKGARGTWDPSLFTALGDERERLDTFARREGLLIRAEDEFPELTDQQLRLYVRETHARRSAARARKFFEHQVGVGEALAHLCEGHWHDFGVLDDPKRFPREYELVGISANLLALALQVRLIDLFHIADDRTPWALWRFVSPKEKRAKEAWAKHRAVHGISIIDFPPGRAIRVQGGTEDEEVWAALQDLRRYCEKQVKGTLELSARHISRKYGLDFIKLDWSVTTGTLRPIDLRFQFDREAMFRILSEEIYDGDPYVFVRELLQNAIDAIRTRRGRYADKTRKVPKQHREPPFDTTVYFNVEHDTSGNIAITCRDFGIGMDEHIIRNYFSTAGISYYRSPEFERQHLGFEPVSRFGVGILSCFMVSDSLEVQTYRDPEFGPPMAHADSNLPGAEQHQARKLSLTIPGVDRQFVVEGITGSFEVGTEVRVHVLANKLRQLRGWKAIAAAAPNDGTRIEELKRNLRITEQLSEIAGFVEFPIHVTEIWPGLKEPRRTLILHPNSDRNVEASHYDFPVTVHQLTREYPWNLVTDPDDLAAASDQMTCEQFELSELLPDRGFEGWLTFPKPKNENWDFSNVDRHPLIQHAGNNVHWYSRDTFQRLAGPIRWRTPQQYSELRDPPMSTLLAVYRDGILLRGITQVALGRQDQIFPLPRICVNLPSSTSSQPNLARTTMVVTDVTWDFDIWRAFEREIDRRYIANALKIEASERLYRLGWISVVFRLSPTCMLDMISEPKRPTVWLTSDSILEVAEGGLECGKEIHKAPDEITFIMQVLAATHFCLKQSETKWSFKWKGPRTLMTQPEDPRSAPLQSGLQISTTWAGQVLRLEAIQFLQPPTGVSDILPQISAVSTDKIDVDEYIKEQTALGVDPRSALLNAPSIVAVLELARTNPNRVQSSDRPLLQRVFPFLPQERPAALPIRFSSPFDGFAITQRGDLNALHPFGQEFYRVLGALGIGEREKKINYKHLEKLNEGIFSHMFFGNEVTVSYNTLEFVRRAFELVKRYKLITGFSGPPTSWSRRYSAPPFAAKHRWSCEPTPTLRCGTCSRGIRRTN
jgi:hypothetical protein